MANRRLMRTPVGWLMTDERIGDLARVLRNLPPGTGVVFRHHATPCRERLALFRRVRSIAVARRLVLVVAGRPLPWTARHDGPQPTTAPAHDRREACAGVRRGARLLFVSPVRATRSHPGAPALGERRALAIGWDRGAEIVALGGMSAPAFRRSGRFDGWAGIDAWTDPRSCGAATDRSD